MSTIHLEQDEKEVLVVRKSLFVFILQTIGFLFLAIIVPKLISFITTHYIAISFAGEAAFIPPFLRATWYLFIWVFYFLRLTDFFLDMWIVTNKRIVDVNQRGLFSRNIATLSLDKIEDVTVDVNGIFPTFLGYGTISVQTAGEEREFTMYTAASPMHAKEVIMRLYSEERTAVRTVKIAP
jgi:uncharacterized membrane protein YdbT with pleckstrin-like domain